MCNIDLHNKSLPSNDNLVMKMPNSERVVPIESRGGSVKDLVPITIIGESYYGR